MTDIADNLQLDRYEGTSLLSFDKMLYLNNVHLTI